MQHVFVKRAQRSKRGGLGRVAPVMILSPSLLKHRLTISAVCPNKLASSSPVSTAHNFAVLSIEPVATIVDCGLKDSATISVWCLSARAHFVSRLGGAERPVDERAAAGQSRGKEKRDEKGEQGGAPSQHVDALARLRVPNPRRLVKGARDNLVTERVVERDGVDHILVALERQDLLARVGVPHLTL